MPSFEEIVKMSTQKRTPTPLYVPVTQLMFIEHEIEGTVIPQRPRDGYINATKLCQKTGKLFGNYYQNKQTKDFLDALYADIGIPISVLVQVIKGGNDKYDQGTWVHPQVAINLGQWLSPEFAVQVSRWVFDWMSGSIRGHMPSHVRRYMKNRMKIPYDCFSMLNELYLNLVAPLEDVNLILPDKVMPDISMGMMFSGFLRKHGINPSEFQTYTHEWNDPKRAPVQARLYPIRHLADFRAYFNNEWLPKHAESYFRKRFPKAIHYVPTITQLPSV